MTLNVSALMFIESVWQTRTMQQQHSNLGEAFASVGNHLVVDEFVFILELDCYFLHLSRVGTHVSVEEVRLLYFDAQIFECRKLEGQIDNIVLLHSLIIAVLPINVIFFSFGRALESTSISPGRRRRHVIYATSLSFLVYRVEYSNFQIRERVN